LPVILRADKRLYYEQVVKVLDGISACPSRI
jgi:biopolymer transport protein ExbD